MLFTIMLIGSLHWVGREYAWYKAVIKPFKPNANTISTQWKLED
jgi:hypothetical protein